MTLHTRGLGRKAVLLALVLLGASASLVAQGPKAGTLDLSALPENSVASLDGEWEFHWSRFLDPSVSTEGPLPGARLAALPGEWKEYGQGFSPQGYGSYRLVVTGLDPRRDWGLRMGSFLSAATVYANGSPVMAFGQPGTGPGAEVPGWYSRLAIVHPSPEGRIELVLHVSNYADRSGGNRTAMYLGDYQAVARQRESMRLYELFAVGALVVMGLYYLFLFAFRPGEKPPLYFGLLCVFLALRITCYDEYFILDLIPGLPWPWLFRLGYLTFTVPVLCTTLFIQTLFPRRSWKVASFVAAAVCLGYSLLFCLGPSHLASIVLPYFQVFTGVTGLYLLGVLVLAILGREPGSLLFLGGFVLFFGAAIHDILVANGALKDNFLVQYGLLVFVFAMSLVITRKLAGAYAQTESLTAELSRANKAMKRFVPAEFLALLKKSKVEEVGLGDHNRQTMSVMFADIRSFSSLSEKLSPEDTFRFINQYLARMGPSIRAHGGFVDKYMGDGIMALFPRSPEDAARCAIEMHLKLADYNVLRAAQGEEAIHIGIGIHCGHIMLGTIGENERMDGTVISDAVNVASRLEGLSKDFGVGVVASEAILKGLAVPSSYRKRYLGKVGVKGKREPVTVYELYDGDPVELRDSKDGIKDTFESALASFYAQDYGQSLARFKQAQEAMPEDGATLYYARIIRKLNLS